jgi:hypothetical protein
MARIETETLVVVARIIAFAILLQSIELLKIRAVIKEDGIWTWTVLRKEFDVFPRPFLAFFEFLLPYPRFIKLLYFQIAASGFLMLYPTPVFAIGLLLSATLCCLRWRGTFNGGSDFMTLIVLTGVSVGLVFSNTVSLEKASLWYITIQACTSYFRGGLSKLRTRNWRSGRALKGFICSSMYPVDNLLGRLIDSSQVLFLMSWVVILFECSFPLALVSPKVCGIYIGLAFVFHLANFYSFGLNRFLFAWMATYPALYFCSHVLRII